MMTSRRFRHAGCAVLVMVVAMASCASDRVERARAALKAGDTIKAGKLLEMEIAEAPQNSEALLMLGELELDSGNTGRGVDRLQQAAKADAAFEGPAAEALSMRAVAALRSADRKTARFFFDAAMRVNPAEAGRAVVDELTRLRTEGLEGGTRYALALLGFAGQLPPEAREPAAETCLALAQATLEGDDVPFAAANLVNACPMPAAAPAQLALAALAVRTARRLADAQHDELARRQLERAREIHEPIVNDDAYTSLAVIRLATEPSLDAIDAWLANHGDSPELAAALIDAVNVAKAGGDTNHVKAWYALLAKRFPSRAQHGDLADLGSNLANNLFAETFRAPLDTKKWTESLATDVGNQAMDIREVRDGQFVFAQTVPADAGSGIMTTRTFPAGTVLRFTFTVEQAQGSWNVALGINQPTGRSLPALAGFWGSTPMASGNAQGTYKVAVKMADEQYVVTVETPQGRTWSQQYGYSPPYFFSINARTGHNGIVRVGISGVTVDRAG